MPIPNNITKILLVSPGESVHTSLHQVHVQELSPTIVEFQSPLEIQNLNLNIPKFKYLQVPSFQWPNLDVPTNHSLFPKKEVLMR